jgi:hypothetical protein
LNLDDKQKAQRLSQKGRDVASFGGGWEALTGQTHFYCALSIFEVCFWCFESFWKWVAG